MGRSKMIVGPEQFEHCARLGMTQTEIAGMFGVTQARVSQLLKRSENRLAWDRGRSNLAENLRAAQIATAFSGDKTMLIWCGKQYLGQVDAPQTRHVEIDQRVSVRYVAEWGRDDQEISGGTANVIEAGEDDWEEEE